MPTSDTFRTAWHEASIAALPDEVLQQLLYYLEPLHVARSVCLVARRFGELAREPLLWRHYCKHGFRYWAESHAIKQDFVRGAAEVDWRAKYADRCRANTKAARLLNEILASSWGRIDKYDEIARLGYDVKEILLEQSQSKVVEDGLARRYHAIAVLNLIHREHAVRGWDRVSVSREADVSLERTLGCFDLFVLRDEYGDLDEISCMLDAIAVDVRRTYPEIQTLDTRSKALSIIGYLRENRLVGLASEETYRDMQNNFLHIALQEPDHPSLPLISASIFCAVAARFDIDARCSGMPAHVYAMVFAKAGETLDGRAANGAVGAKAGREYMYLDPYRSVDEVPADVLRRMLLAWGIPASEHAGYMGPCQAAALAIRTSRNILTTVQEHREHQAQGLITHPRVQIHGHPAVDLENAFYSALWANFLLSPTHAGNGSAALREFVGLIIDKVDRTFPEDAHLVLQCVRAKSHGSTFSAQETEDRIAEILRRDRVPCQPRHRALLPRDKVAYKIGQVFQHRRYGYYGVITGWDAECSLGDEWIVRNGVDALPGGRKQSFYNALVEDNSMRYVAEENIQIVTLTQPERLMDLAGRHFKRWDADRHVFISNILDAYPDD